MSNDDSPFCLLSGAPMEKHEGKLHLHSKMLFFCWCDMSMPLIHSVSTIIQFALLRCYISLLFLASRVGF